MNLKQMSRAAAVLAVAALAGTMTVSAVAQGDHPDTTRPPDITATGTRSCRRAFYT